MSWPSAVATPRTIRAPSTRSPLRISTNCPSVSPGRNSTATGPPPGFSGAQVDARHASGRSLVVAGALAGSGCPLGARGLARGVAVQAEQLRAEAQRRRRNAQRVLGVGDLNPHVGGHPGQQLQVGVVDLDDDRVGHDVVGDLGREADLRDLAEEVPLRVGVHREPDGLPFLDLADVRLVHLAGELHPRKVLGDREQGRRLERRRHRLPHVVVAGDHDAVDRRADDRVLQVRLGLPERRLELRHLRHRLVEDRLGGLQFVLRDEPGLEQRPLALELDLAVEGGDLGAVELSPGFADGGFERGGVEGGEDLAVAHLTVEVAVQRRDDPGDLRADLDRGHGGQSARRGDALDDRSAVHERGRERRLPRVGPPEQSPSSRSHRRDCNPCHDDSHPFAHRNLLGAQDAPPPSAGAALAYDTTNEVSEFTAVLKPGSRRRPPRRAPAIG